AEEEAHARRPGGPGHGLPPRPQDRRRGPRDPEGPPREGLHRRHRRRARRPAAPAAPHPDPHAGRFVREDPGRSIEGRTGRSRDALMAKLNGRSFINTLEFKPAELEFLLDRAAALKKTRGKKGKLPLAGKSVALVFFNPSLRTRVSFEVGIAELGGTAVTMSVGSESWSLEYKEGAVMDQDKTEHIKDAAQVLSRYVDAICVRSFPGMKSYDEDMSDPVISSFKKYSTVPVINMESALWHPCQALADAFTMQERLGKLKGKKVTLTWAYHPKALPMAVGNSFAAIVSQLGADLTIAHPPEFALEKKF